MRPSKLINWIIAILLLSVLVYYVDIGSSFDTILRSDPGYVLLLGITVIVTRSLRALKWAWLLRALGIFIGNIESIRLVLIGLFVGAWTPASVGGDIYRVVALRHHKKNGLVTSSLILERYVSLLTVALLILFGLPWTVDFLLEEINMLASVIGIIVLLFLGTPLFIRYLMGINVAATDGQSSWLINLKKAIGKIRSPLQSILQHKPKMLFGFVLLGLLETLLTVVITFLAVKALGHEVGFGYLLCAMPFVFIALRVPISIQGIGIQEGALVYALLPAGIDAEIAVALSVLLRISDILFALLPGALFFVLSNKDSRNVT